MSLQMAINYFVVLYLTTLDICIISGNARRRRPDAAGDKNTLH
jgi:hypothetical protein